jgi:hypothetical protein
VTWGPWSPTCHRDERVPQLRTLRTLAHLHLGPEDPWVAQLRAAETDPMAFVQALEGFERIPALRRRQVLASFAAINWPPATTRKE